MTLGPWYGDVRFPDDPPRPFLWADVIDYDVRGDDDV